MSWVVVICFKSDKCHAMMRLLKGQCQEVDDKMMMRRGRVGGWNYEKSDDEAGFTTPTTQDDDHREYQQRRQSDDPSRHLKRLPCSAPTLSATPSPPPPPSPLPPPGSSSAPNSYNTQGKVYIQLPATINPTVTGLAQSPE